MYLKKIEMRGFKTFADRTELEFGPGITAVVGPNGVGKSNIADAIVWAMGEQSNRALRTEASGDVIFAGSEGRRPVGLAEVALTLDNGDGALGIDFSEVILSRRLFRSGDSEYLLNRATARLRDIRDMLVDTGIGPGAYSTVGQGEIDAILSIRSEDRRELIEEVAGIRKYRLRRDEATRRLEATEANMTRVADIVAELSSQRAPLEAQAEVARRYNELSERLRELDLHLLAGDYQRRRLRLGKLANDLEVTKADLQGTRNRLSEVDAEYERVQFDLARLADEVDRLRDEATRAERELDQARQAQELASERLRATLARRDDLTAALDDRRRRVEETSGRLEAVGAEHETVTRELAEATEECRALEAELTARAAELQAKADRVGALEREQAQLLERAVALENESLALRSLETDLGERAQRLSQQSEALAARELQAHEDLLAAQARREELGAATQERAGELADLRATLTRASRTLQEHRHKCSILAGAVTAAEARRELLQELDRAREGFSDGARAAVRAGARGELQGIIGIVADLLDVPARFERAVEAALGDALQWVVTETEEQAAAGARRFVAGDAGRATFIPLSAFVTEAHATPPDAPAFPGSLGPALKAVRFRREHERLLGRLLGDTIIVRDLETALALRQRMRTRARLVTLSGEVVRPDGAVTAGGEQGAGAQAFARRRELEVLSRDLAAMQSALAAMWQREENLDQWCTRLTEQIHGVEAELSGLRSEQVAAESDATHLAGQERAARQAAAELSQEAEAIAERLAQARARRQEAESEGERLRAQAGDLGKQVEQARAEGPTQAQVEALRAGHVGAQVRVAELGEKERSAARLRERHGADLERLQAEVAAAETDLAAAGEAEQALRAALATPGRDMTELEQSAGAARAAVQEGAGRLSALREKSAQLEGVRGRLHEVAQDQSDRIHRAELALAREEAQIEHIIERLQDAYGFTPDEAFAERFEEVRENEVRREANELREEIRRLGPVNLSAIDECERLAAREDFLTGQLDDLRAARADLLQVIGEIDQVATSEFLAALDRLRGAFQEMFVRLFDGGQTELRLSNEENPLEAGVDVIVQVPGKRRQNLLLLSGGERALTALALIFAMLRVKPSPFCVMDEIDAALDESNVGRFVQVLKEFAQETQFIIVTHNPHTIEAADVLFGVTMDDPGVSKLLRLELREWEDFLSEAESQVAAVRAPRAGSRVLPTTT